MVLIIPTILNIFYRFIMVQHTIYFTNRFLYCLIIIYFYKYIPDPATPTVAAPAPINFAAESMSRLTVEVWKLRTIGDCTKILYELDTIIILTCYLYVNNFLKSLFYNFKILKILEAPI